MSEYVVPRRGHGAQGFGWFIQYPIPDGDIRVDCPVCHQWEAFYLRHADVASDGLVVNIYKPCRGCGFAGPFSLEGYTLPALSLAEREAAFDQFLNNFVKPDDPMIVDSFGIGPE